MSGKLKKYNDESFAHFITTITANRYPYFLEPHLCQILVDNIKFYQRQFNLEVYGWVIMPDHLHLLVWWDGERQPNLTISKVMHGIKWHSAKQISEYLLGRSGASARPDEISRHGARAVATHRTGQYDIKKVSCLSLGRSGASARPAETNSQGAGALTNPEIKRLRIWPPSFYDFNIYSEEKLEEKLNYLKNNVIHAGFADEWQNYPWIYLKY